jgi:hypothetical protein
MYIKEVKLQHNEIAGKINLETGEVIPLVPRKNNIPKDKVIHKYGSFYKVNDKAISFLKTVLSTEELGVVLLMIDKSNYQTNVLVPLNDSTSLRQLEEEFNIGRNRVKKIFDKLYKLGVYAQVRVANGIYNEYWTLNPYISWKGKFIPQEINCYFDKTIIANSIRVME